MKDKRVTLRDIGLKIGLHHSTISRALRNDRLIPEETRQRVAKAASALGYRPDPMLSALVAYRIQNQKKSNYEGTIGWITNYPTRDGWHVYEKKGYFIGATRQAAELGYRIEVFWLNEPGMTARRITEILKARNIQGLLFIPQPRSRAHLHLEWEQFSAVTLGPTLSSPPLRVVDNDHFRSMIICMRQLKRLGYRRPGFACDPRVHNSIDRSWEAAYRVFQSVPLNEQIPSFMNQPWTIQEFGKWYAAYKPDVIISQHKDILTWLRKLGIKVPKDVGFVISAQHAAASKCAGINENNELVGEAAVSVVADMVNRGERGIPKTRTAFTVEGKWEDGPTVRRQHSSPSKSQVVEATV